MLGAPCGTDPVQAARALALAAGPAVVVVGRGAGGHWARAFEHELAECLSQGEGSCLVFSLGPGEPVLARAGLVRVGLEKVLAPAARRAFWDAAAAELESDPLFARLEALDDAWARACAGRERPSHEGVHAGSAALGSEALVALRWLRVAGCALPHAALPAAGVEDLTRARLAVATAPGDGWVVLTLESDVLDLPDVADPADAERVAQVLLSLDEPVARLRAAELLAHANEVDAAEHHALAAVSDVLDTEARADAWERWEACAALRDASVERLLRYADFAGRVGDVDRALGFARRAVERRGADPAVLLALGRATAQRGDLVGAAAALEQAAGLAVEAHDRARAWVEQGEVAYLAGDLDRAGELARRTIDELDTLFSGGDPQSGLRAPPGARVRLDARNVLGKLLLAAGHFADADAHFAADAVKAMRAGDSEAELRARLNRAIAALSDGRRDDARSMLEAVLADGTERKELRAVSFALGNLATLATLQRQYGEALRLSEQAIDVRRRLGERVGLARLVTNLAALRLRLGLVSEAEQALLFGRQACGASVPGIRASHFALVSARLHLERRQLAEARAELDRAIGSALSSSDGAKLGECHRLAVRVALDEGDVPRARRALEEATRCGGPADALAELAALEAALARARGDDHVELAEAALDAARPVDDDELLLELHLLLFQAKRDAGRADAKPHLTAAAELRDRALAGLPPHLAPRFLGRRDLALLARLEASVGGAASVATGLPVASPRGLAKRALVGAHASMVALQNTIQKVGKTSATVLVRGESGTGKELVAEALHDASPRRAGPLVKLNCSALVEDLLLSELFGHERGAFTGATARRRGRFELADGGTLFLDEIGDISPRTQVALLRVLQERTFERVGGSSPVKVDVRIVCATHRDLRALVAKGQFREDLYYRLRQVEVVVPPLRARTSDLASLARHVLERAAHESGMPQVTLTDEGVRLLESHAWPGNVRELENVLRAAALFCEGGELGLRELAPHLGAHGAIPAAPASGPPSGRPSEPRGSEPRSAAPSVRPAGAADAAYAAIRSGTSLPDLRRQVERECIVRALAETGGNITRAAALLGMKRPRLSQLAKEYGMSAGKDDEP